MLLWICTFWKKTIEFYMPFVSLAAMFILSSCGFVNSDILSLNPLTGVPTSPVIPPKATFSLKQLGASFGGQAKTWEEDECEAVTTDSSGNVYCAGSTYGSLGETNGGENDAFVLKLDSSGKVLWIKQLGAVTAAGGASSQSDLCASVAVDSSGNVYCAGSTYGSLGEANGGYSDAFVMKLDSEGKLVWLTQLGGTTLGVNTSKEDYCNAVTVDASANVYCAGSTQGNLGEANGGITDAFVLKLDSDGNVLWVKQMGSVSMPGNSSRDDGCSGVGVDLHGNVYCGGTTRGSLGELNGATNPGIADYDVFVMKLDAASGDLEWLKQLGALSVPAGAASNDDWCNGFTVDSSGNSYCAGTTRGNLGEANGGDTDAFVVKVDTGGNLDWITQLGASTIVSGNDSQWLSSCNSVAVDLSGNIYCAGDTNGPNDTDDDAIVMKLNPSGGVEWFKKLGDDFNAYCSGAAADSSGNVYCAGLTEGSWGELQGGGGDVFVTKLNSSGDVTWTRQLGYSMNSEGYTIEEDRCYGTATDSQGNLYCAGSTRSALGEANGGDDDAFIMKINPSGNVVWIKQLGAVTSVFENALGTDSCQGVAVDDLGNVYCAGLTYSDLGEYNGGGLDAFVMKLNPSGNVEWIKQLGTASVPGGDTSGDEYCHGVAVDSSGYVYCAGSTSGDLGEANGGGDEDAFVMKLDPSGNVVWIKQLGAITSVPGGGAAGDEYCRGVAVDSSGNVYCAGSTSGSLGEANGGDEDAFVMKLDPSGNVEWIKQLGDDTPVPGGDTSDEDVCWGVVVDSEDNIYCAGSTYGSLGEANGGDEDAFLMKLNPLGNVEWIKQLGAVTSVSGGSTSGRDSCYGVSVDPGGNVYCAGSTGGALGESNGGNDDAFVLKIDSTGDIAWIKQLGGESVPVGSAFEDRCNGVAVDASGSVYCVGTTRGSLAETNGGNIDIFYMKLNSDGSLSTP